MGDDFVPEGRVSLVSAIKQIAEARQTNVPSAQAEVRLKLRSGTIVAQVMERSTGRLFDILPEPWATETALRWLESGTCLLPNEKGKVTITRERFDMFYLPENAPIFILEVDLKRLIGPASARKAGRPVISDAEARRRFQRWREGCGDYVPSQKEDVRHMRQLGVSRKRTMALRKETGVRRRPRGPKSIPSFIAPTMAWLRSNVAKKYLSAAP
jgi:hypothetical protein